MVKIHWKIKHIPYYIYSSIQHFCHKCHYTVRSLTYNHFMDQSYAADVFMEPLFWFVDNFTQAIGIFFVIAVTILTSAVVGIAYWIGLPYWWNRNRMMCVILVIIGNWLLVNIIFHYYMACVTPPGYPPQGEITAAVSICKKCIAPKPPRTHHCSVCNRCILKMDHHCPWLNNCVGFRNHRYFFMYMVYMVAGVLFIMLGGIDLAYTHLWLSSDDTEEPELEGHPVKFNKTGALIPVTDIMYLDSSLLVEEDLNQDFEMTNPWKKRALLFMALINFGVFVALGSLSVWHSRLIAKGETSIEANINRTETTRMAALGKKYSNPYNFGAYKNWKMFLGLVQGRSWFRHILLPSPHEPLGDGLTWYTIYDEETYDEWA